MTSTANRRTLYLIKPPYIFDCFICKKTRNDNLVKVDEKRWAHVCCYGPYLNALEDACKQAADRLTAPDPVNLFQLAQQLRAAVKNKEH